MIEYKIEYYWKISTLNSIFKWKIEENVINTFGKKLGVRKKMYPLL